MPRYLVVANQTLGSVELREEIRKRFQADPNSFFFVLVPNTHAADYHGVPVAGGFVPMPSLITASGPATNEEATALAQHQLDQLLKRLRELGVKAEGELGDPDPLKAIGEVLARDRCDEVIISTLPQRVSKWLHTDLPYKVQHRFQVPVTTVTAT
jgi:GABA permease